MDEKNVTIIKETIADLVSRMGFDCRVEINAESSADLAIDDTEEAGGDGMVCNITLDRDSNFLIGQYGTNLQALQHIARLILRKKISERIRFVLDVNSYRHQKNQSIIESAHSTAAQAINEKRAVAMKPMSAYERRLVHMELSKNEAVKTESVGEGDDRKIIVKPASSIE